MRTSDLKIKELAPANGQLLAYTRQAVIFKPYTSVYDVAMELEGVELLEIHMFDDEKEYRAISTESRRFEEGYIEHVSQFPFNNSMSACENRIADGVYVEPCAYTFKHEKGIVTVLNHLSYDDGGMVTIDDYRLVMGGRQNG